VAVDLVVVHLLGGLGLLEAEADVGEELFTFFHRLGHRSHSRVTGS
jgi:hypothetical protein